MALQKFSLILCINLFYSVSILAQQSSVLKFITNDTSSVIAPEFILDKEANRIYYLKNEIGNLKTSTLCYYNLSNNRNYKLNQFKAFDLPKIIKSENGIVSLFVPVDFANFQIVEINTETQNTKSIMLPEAFNRVYFSRFFQIVYLNGYFSTFSFESQYLKVYKNDFNRPVDSLKLDGKLLNSYFDKTSMKLYCLEQKKKLNLLQLEVIDINNLKISSNNFILNDENIEEAGIAKISDDSLAIWYGSDSYNSNLIIYSLKNNIVVSKNAFNSSIKGMIIENGKYYINLAYHSGKFYNIFFDNKSANSSDSLKQTFSVSLYLDIVGNLFFLNMPNNDEIVNINTEEVNIIKNVEEPLIKKYPRISGKGEKSLEVDLENIGTQKGQLYIYFQAFSAKDRLKIIQDQNGLSQILYDTQDLISGSINASIPLTSFNGTKILFVITTKNKSSNWFIDYELKTTHIKTP